MKDKRLREIKRVWERERERKAPHIMVIFAKNERKYFFLNTYTRPFNLPSY